VNVLPVVAGELAAVNDRTVWPAGSVAVTVNVMSVFSAPDTVAGAVTNGGRPESFTVITVRAVPVRALAAVNVTV
jgi:hypothetical protein